MHLFSSDSMGYIILRIELQYLKVMMQGWRVQLHPSFHLEMLSEQGFTCTGVELI